MSSSQPDSPLPASLFHEPGASWYWVLGGPAAALAMLLIQTTSGNGYNPLMPATFLVLVSGFVALQVKAARIHTSVELTAQTLRQGAETIRVGDIIKIYPEAEDDESEDWQSARALGELTGVPRGRGGVGLRLTGGRTVQAWARRHRQLRAALAPLVVERTVDDDDTGSSRW